MKLLAKMTSCFIWKMAELAFIGLMVVTLPLWFFLLALWVIIDPLYHLQLWRSRSETAKVARRREVGTHLTSSFPVQPYAFDE